MRYLAIDYVFKTRFLSEHRVYSYANQPQKDSYVVIDDDDAWSKSSFGHFLKYYVCLHIIN